MKDYASQDAFPFLHHQLHRDYSVASQVSERRCPVYEDWDSCDDRISAGIATDLKRQKASAIAYDVEAGDFCYFFHVRISVVVSGSNWETVCVSLVVEATKIGSRPTANVCGGVEKVSRNVDDEAEVNAFVTHGAEGRFGGKQDCGILNASESGNV